MDARRTSIEGVKLAAGFRRGSCAAGTDGLGTNGIGTMRTTPRSSLAGMLLPALTLPALVLAAVLLSAVLPRGWTTAMATTPEPAFATLPATATGMLVVGADAALAAARRSGPKGAVVFGRDAAAYRWLFLPALADEKGEPLTVRLAGGDERRFDNVVIATEAALARRGVPGGYVVVEAEINAGLGSLPSDRFVATKLRVLDSSDGVPPGLDAKVREAIRRCGALPGAAGADKVLDDLGSKTFAADASPMRQDTLVPRVTWLAEQRAVRVTCTAEIALQLGGGDIGTVPGDPRLGQRTPQGQPPLLHGKRVSVGIEAAYSISPDGQLSEVSRSEIEARVTEPPPRGGNVPRR